MTTKAKQPTVADILKKEGIIHLNINQNLSQALSKLTSSHDAAFIFDDEDNFIGIISPHMVVNNRSLKSSSKLKTCAKMPQKLYPNDTLSKVATAMINTKTHFLPVFNNQHKFEGITTIRRLLRFIVDNKLLNGNDKITFSNRKMVTIDKDTTLSQAITIMKQKRVAKLPVVDHENKIVGIIAQYDIKNLTNNNEAPGRLDKTGNKKSHLRDKVKNHMKKMVYKLDHIPSFSQAVQSMINKKIGSIIVVDDNNSPIGIITKKDLLQTIANRKEL